MVRKKAKNSLKEKMEKGVDCCNPFGTQPARPPTVAKVLRQFVDNTTLIGIPHIIRKRSIWWLFAFIACMSLSIYQSLQSAITYIDQVSHQSVSVQSTQALPWPSVTVCNNVVLLVSRLNDGSVPGYVNITNLPCDLLNNETYVDSVRESNVQKVAEYVRRNLTEEERRNQSLSRDDWLDGCTFSYDPCNFTDTNQFYEFNSPYYGNCFTFNPAIAAGSGLASDIDSKLIFKFSRFGIGYQLAGRKPFVSMLIHSPGTAPLMDLPEAIDIYDGQNVNVGMRMIQNDFMLKARTVVPTCVVDGASGHEFRAKSFYYSKSTPYRYSLEACMKACFQTKVFSPCNYLDATFNKVQNKTYEETFDLQLPPITACPATEDLEIGTKECECPFGCKYYQYVYSLDTTNLDAKEPNARCDQAVENTDDAKRLSLMKVGVQFLSNIYDYKVEVLDYDLTQFLGFLGGNVSLWLGLCVLSLLEVVELVWDMIVVGWQNRAKKKVVVRPHLDYDKRVRSVPVSYPYHGYSLRPITKTGAVPTNKFY